MKLNFDKRFKWQWLTCVFIALLQSLIITLYLAPTKQPTANLLAAAALIINLGSMGVQRPGIVGAIRPLAPLFVLMLWVVIFSSLNGEKLDSLSYVLEILIGFIPFLLFYLVFRNLAPAHVPMQVVAVFLIPGLIHLVLMYQDIFLSLRNGNELLLTKPNYCFLECIKDTPRVGRRYESYALIQLLAAGLLIAWHFRRTHTNYWGWGLVSISAVSLTLLDARAAYVSIIIGGGLLIMALGPARAWWQMQSFLTPGVRLLLASLLISTAVTGYSTGKSRWLTMSYSFKAAVHDVFYSEVDLVRRPFVNENYWSAPIEEIDACFVEGLFRCKVDQSAYLRMAWLLSGMESLVKHPWGIGYSKDYMARLWEVVGKKGYYQRSDSFFVQQIVCFGLWGIIPIVMLVSGLLRSMRSAAGAGNASAELVSVGGIVIICFARGLVDVLSDGFWLYVTGMMGMYYGLLHSFERE